MSCYNYDDIRDMLEKKLSEEKTLLAAWEKVTFPTKKDDKPFANMAKNFDGAKYQLGKYLTKEWEYELTVYAYDNKNGHISDYFPCYETVAYLKDEKKIAKTENYMPKIDYCSQAYKYDLEDIKDGIAKRIEHHKKRIASLEHQIEISKDVFEAFKTAYGNAISELEKACGNDEFYSVGNDLYYAVRDTVKDRYPYC